MFGLTKREQRWTAAQQAVEVMAGVTVIRGVAGAQTDAAELARLRAENADLRRLLARYRDETPLGNQPHMIGYAADEALGRS